MPPANRYTPDRSKLLGSHGQRPWFKQRNYNIRVMIPENKITLRQDVENVLLNCALGGYLRIKNVGEVEPAVGPVETIRENQIKQVIVRGDGQQWRPAIDLR